LLLFEVGLESDLRALIRVGPSALLVALLGVVAPVALGWGVTAWLLPESPLLIHLFIGATLAGHQRRHHGAGAARSRSRPEP
jgi:Kef-type K+ transport system membrane component KefB